MGTQKVAIQERILNAAESLFNREGYCPVGVDKVCEEAEVSKATLYKYFQNKEGLIEQVLLRRDANFRNTLTIEVKKGNSAWEKIDGIIEWHLRWFKSAHFSGCMFVAAYQEFYAVNDQIIAVVRAHKLWLKALIEQCLNQDNDNRFQLAQMILIFIEGMISCAMVFDKNDESLLDKDLIRKLVEAE